MKKILLLLIVILSATQNAFTDPINPELLKGWEYFAKNDLEKARATFNSLLDGPQKSDAYRALSLLEAADGKGEKVLDYFIKFYDNASNPEPYLESLWSVGSGRKKENELTYLKSIAAKENSTLRALANQTIASHYYHSGDLKTALEYYAKTGAIREWSMVGEFENISESGFDKDFGVLAHPEKNHFFTNKRGVKVKWFNLVQPRFDNWVDFEYHFYTSNSIIYAQTFCTSPVERETQFRLGVSGSVKVWVNDQLLFSEAQERDNDLDTYIFSAKLAKGNNRILVQIGSSEIDNSNFLLRITDKEGNLWNDLSYSPEPQTYPKDYRYSSEVRVSPTEEYFLKKIEENPDYIENYLNLTQMYTHQGMLYKAKRILKESKKRFPDCSYVNFQMIRMYMRDDNNTGLSQYLEEVRVNDPDNALALELEFNEAVQTEDLDKAQEILDKIKKREGSSQNVLEKEIQLASENEKVEELIRLIDLGYAKYPDSEKFTLYKYYIEKDSKKNPKGASKILVKFLKNAYSDDAVKLMAGYYFDTGNAYKGLETYKTLLDYNPTATGYFSQISRIYFQMGQYNTAEEYVKKCIEIAPYVGSYHRTLGETFEQVENKEKAIESYMQAIFYNPYDYDAREKLRKIRGQKAIFENFPDPDVYAIYDKSPEASAFPEDNSMVLLDEVQKVIYDGGGSEERQIFVVKVFNSTGVDRWKEYRIPIMGNQSGVVEKAEVLKGNGKRLSAERSGAHVVFSNLEVGDAIYLSYRTQNYNSGKLASHFWGKHYFSYFYPILESRYSLMVPEGRKFAWKATNPSIQPTVKSVAGDAMEKALADPTKPGENINPKGEIYVWERKNVPSMKYEPYMSELSDVGDLLHISSFEDWDYISEWYADLAQAKAKDNFEVREVADELFSGKENISDRQKVHDIYDYIVENIRYVSVPFLQSGLVPQKSSRVIAAKQGDCKDVSTLFVAMCKAEGIDANLVLVNTRDNGLKDMILPSIDFNHCIAKVNLDEKDYFVELTTDNLPFSSGLSSMKNVFTLEIPSQTGIEVEARIIDPESRVRNAVRRTATVVFEDDNMVVDKNSHKSGVNAYSMRDTYENIGEEAQFKSMQEAINDEYPNIRLTKLNFLEGLEGNSETIDYEYSYEVPSIFTVISGLEIFTIPWSDGQNNPDFVSTTDRKFPIELWQYYTGEYYSEEITVVIPEGKVLSEVPAPVNLNGKYISYSLSYAVEGRTLKARRVMQINNDVVAPEDYQSFKNMVGQMVKADKQNLAFKAAE